MDLDEEENAFITGTYVTAGDHLWRAAEVFDGQSITHVMLLKIEFENDALNYSDALDLGDALIDDYGSYSLNETCFTSNELYVLSSATESPWITAIDMQTGDTQSFYVDTKDHILDFTSYGERKLLLCTDDEEDPGTVSILLFDMDSGEITKAGIIETGNLKPEALCYDAERAQLYYVLNSEVWHVPVKDGQLGIAEAFSNIPFSSARQTVMLDDLLVINCAGGVVGRDVTVEHMPEQHLTIANSTGSEAIEQAYFDFTALHPEYSVTIRNGVLDMDEVIQAMMTEDNSTDIYIVDSDGGIFSALLHRGFMAELSTSDQLTSYANSVYPGIADAGRTNDELYAIPLGFYAELYGLNMTALSQLGFTEDELPTTWPQMLDLLARLSDGRMEEMPELSISVPGQFTKSSFKFSILADMLDSYLLWLDTDEEHLSSGSDLLMQLLDAFEQIDWTGFGLTAEYEEVFEYNQSNVIIDSYLLSPNQIEQINSGEAGDVKLLTLSVAEGEQPVIGAQTAMAFVNPFSENREAAIEYLELSMPQIDASTRIKLCPQMNEPVENADYQEKLQTIDEQIAAIQENLNSAEEEGDDDALAELTENLDRLNEQREIVQSDRWAVSPDAVALYRSLADGIVSATTNIWSGSDDVYSLLSQYSGGAIDAQRFATELENILLMSRMEEI